jgi:glucose-6-phosphate 1-dehydrogenase
LDDETVENKESRTATYAEMVLRIDNDRWKGVPFILKSCKAVDEDVMRVTVKLKANPKALYGDGQGNELIIQKAPEEKVFIKCVAKAPGMEPKEVRTDLSLVYKDRYKNVDIPQAYEVILKSVIEGDHSICKRNSPHPLALSTSES